ncbi:MAG: 2-oxoglutarate dehydrogenase complex dihydrolipoyllysine-residue succinyltransferase [Betaproteobacteria bacterium]
MAIIEVKVPQLSESVSEATLLDWHKKEGEAVARDENLIDIETDKVVLELPAPADGVLVRIIKQAKDSVGSGDVIAQIDTEARAGAAPAVPKASPQKGAEEKKKEAPPVMPAAQKIAAEKGVDTSKISGSGRDGRVTKADVLSQAERPAAAARAPLQQPTPPINVDQLLSGRPEQRVPMSRLRQRVAERLVMAQHTAAILTTFNEVNMAPVMEMRKKYQERFEKEHATRLGFMSFFVKAAVHALKRFPVVNASIDGTDIVYHGYFDVGVAVGSPRGLVVPILRDADRMSFAEIEKKIGDFGRRAQDGKLGIEELTGGTFSISNGGVFGSMLSTPILNPPQSAILGVHATKERAVVEAGQVVVRPMNYLALSYDHRIIDGREAVLFLVSIKEALEDPARLILEL